MTVTAAAAVLVLAHHPQFRPERHQPVGRDASRVDRLFQLILASCRPLPGLAPFCSGAGLPNTPIAVGVAPWRSHAPPREPATFPAEPPATPRHQEDPLRAPLAQLGAAMQSAGLIQG